MSCDNSDIDMSTTQINTASLELTTTPEHLSTNDGAAKENQQSGEQQSKSESRLLALPPEIRNEVFDLAIVKRDKDGDLVPIPIRTMQCFRKLTLRPLFINRQLRKELLPVFFGSNLFVFQQYHNADSGGAFASTDAFKKSLSHLCIPGSEISVTTYAEHEWDRKKFGIGRANSLTGNIIHARFGMLMPPKDWCALMRHVKFVVTPPFANDSRVPTPSNFKTKEVDWPAALRRLQDFGFKELEEIQVHLMIPSELVPRRDYAPAFVAFADSLKPWVETELSRVDTLGGKLSITYEELPKE